jgi:hypothetical protein
LCAPRRMRSEIRDFSKLFLKIGLFISSLERRRIGNRGRTRLRGESALRPVEGHVARHDEATQNELDTVFPLCAW